MEVDRGRSPSAARSHGETQLKLVGTLSNRSAIGAKVRVKATIRGQATWQLRKISGGSGGSVQNDLRANVGLGDATIAETVRIEWPSGIVQEMHNVAAKQFLTVTEPPQLAMTGIGRFRVRGREM